MAARKSSPRKIRLFSEDIVPLCSGWVLLTDRNDQTVKLINVANGSVGESYPSVRC